ncbi:lactate utilization protein [Breoghania sp.]|uniref:LutC/YkgG family protein n=1 Tax=Breoghania sp. TaxID=2065378 RepID=UPI002AAA8E3D|nr:lactate utilization protein [Breoghania sp.]
MSGRAEILAGLKKSLASTGEAETARKDAVAARLKDAPTGIIPARGQLPADELVALFTRMAESVQTSVERVTTGDEAPAAIARLLARRNLPAVVRIGEDQDLAAMPWQAYPALEVRHGPSDGKDAVAVSHAIGAIAETGTLVLTSGTDNPTTLNFLPELHIIVLSQKDIHGDMETIWRGLRETYGKAEMPRVVNMVTGPSRSADIEQTLILGAHGPRALHVIIVEG